MRFTNVSQAQPADEKLYVSYRRNASCPGEQPTTWEELVGGEVSLLPHTPAWLFILFIIIAENTLYKQSGSGELLLFII